MTSDDEAPIAIEATIDGVIRQYKDGSWAIRVLIDPPSARMYLLNMSEVGTRIAIARLGKPDTPPAASDGEVKRAVAEGRAAPAKGAYGQQAKALRLHTDWMGNPGVWEAFGGDEDYLKWVREQMCCAHSVECSGDVVAAHVRRIANGAGTGIKPRYSAVALCDHHHRMQHQHGEDFFERTGKGKGWFDQQRIKHVHEWLWQAIKYHFGVDSMSQLDPADMLAYAVAAGIDQYLPECYRQ